jgi:GNAT superfamily N-acetyltransferase
MTALRQEFHIRPANETDAAYLFELAPRLAGVPRPAWHSAEAMAEFQDRFMKATLHPPQDGSITLVATAAGDGRRLGYIHAHPSKDGVTDEPCGYVALIALDEAAEGLGIAGGLMAEAEAWARAQGWRFLSLDVFAGNKRAINFYTRGGFQPETIRLVKPL